MSKSEIEWTKEYLIPLLQSLGFRRVDFVHGTLEAGRDLIFADHDRFGLSHYYCAQVKDGDIKAQSVTGEIRTILNQLQTAYETPYNDPLSGTQHKIRAVYLIINGKITDPARNILFCKTGGWLSIIDRSQLDVANYVGRAPLEDSLNSATQATNIECFDNKEKWKDFIHCNIDEKMPTLPLYPLQSTAAKQLLEVAWNILDANDIYELVTYIRIIDAITFVLGKIPIGQLTEHELTALKSMHVMCQYYNKKADIISKLITDIEETGMPLPGKRFPRFSPQPEDETSEDEECLG